MRAFVSLILPALTGCGLFAGTPVHFVVPDGYRGLFYLIPDPTNGVVVTKSGGPEFKKYSIGNYGEGYG
jgi:hypothetical protein